MTKLFDSILQRELQPEVWEWLASTGDSLAETGSKTVLFTAFTVIPRRTGKAVLSVTDDELAGVEQCMPGFSLKNYTVDRLARVWLLMRVPAEDKSYYVKTITELFKGAEMNELVALYGALPLLSYPDEWRQRCIEGIRSNIGLVLEAIMCDNPYPAENLDEAAWNQLVLKAFFTEKPVNRIIGLDERANRTLAYILSDYAHERWAAGRKVDPLLWRSTARFIDERLFADLEKVFQQGGPEEKAAAVLAFQQSNYLPAKQLMENAPGLRAAIERNELSWDNLSHSIQTV